MADLLIATLIDEGRQVIDTVSFRDRSQLAAWLTRTEVRSGDTIILSKGGRRPAVPAVPRIAINEEGEASVIPFPPPQEKEHGN